MLVRSAALPMGWSLEKFPSYGLEQLHAAFAEIVEDARSFAWKGIEIFRERKPARDDQA